MRNWTKLKKWASVVTAAVLTLLLISCSARPDPALLEFPGLKWNDTPEQVMEKLDLSADQILENAMANPGENTGYDIWNLTITDLEFMGSQADRVQFLFIRYPDCNYILMRVQLYLAEDTDMNALRAELMEIYGDGTTDPRPNYIFTDGKIQESNTDRQSSGDGSQHYWYAAVTGTDVLSAQAVERYAEHTAGSTVYEDKQAAIEYLDLVPVAQLCCATGDGAVSLLEGTEAASSNVVIYSADHMVQCLQRFEE